MRGMLSADIQKAANLHLGRSITTEELRLMAYVQYVMVNEQKIEPCRVNADDRKILAKWRKERYIEGGASGLSITWEFWYAICVIIWLGYVAYRGKGKY